MASQYKSRATGKRMNWELPSPIASSSPIVTQWQHLWRRECRSTDTLTGAPLVTVIEAGEKTWTDTTLTVETKELGRTETTPRNEHWAGEEVVTMKQVEEETLLVAESGTQKGAENETGSVTFVGNVVRTITGSGTNSAPRTEAATHTETGTRRLAIPTSSNMDIQPTGPRYSKSPGMCAF